MASFLDNIDLGDLATVGGAILGGFDDDDDNGGDRTTTSIQPVQPRTEGQAKISDFDVLYRQQAVANLDQLGNDLGSFSNHDRTFFQSVYQPFQQSIIESNTKLLPTIERVASGALEANARDIVDNQALKNTLRNQASTGDESLRSALGQLNTELDNIPTVEERVGQALSQVEGSFSKAGRELTRNFQSRGQTVSQSSARGLAIEKAKARSGAAGAASEAARKEQLAGAQTRLGATGQVSQIEAASQAQDVSSLSSLQAGQQAGLATPQISGVTETTGLDAASIQAGVIQAAAGQSFGTRSRADTVSQTQKGVVSPALTSGATGVAPDGVTEGDTINTSPGEPAGPGGVLRDVRPIGKNLMDAVRASLDPNDTRVGGIPTDPLNPR